MPSFTFQPGFDQLLYFVRAIETSQIFHFVSLCVISKFEPDQIEPRCACWFTKSNDFEEF